MNTKSIKNPGINKSYTLIKSYTILIHEKILGTILCMYHIYCFNLHGYMVSTNEQFLLIVNSMSSS